jgi:hypothetical protein
MRVMRAWLASLLLLAGCGSETPRSEPPRPRFVIATFNTGTNPGMGHNAAPDDGYSEAHAALSDQYYGDGLAWSRAVEDTRRFFERTHVDVIAFQEIFHSELCVDVPAEARAGFVCERWVSGDPTVAAVIMGAGFQIACHVGHPDKCIAVRRSFATIRGCNSDFCLEGLAGAPVVGCGRGARVGRGVLDLVSGGTLTVVNVHGSSGIDPADQDCRTKQFQQAFVDLGVGDGAAANGERNVVLGDLNTDPLRLANGDPSAAYFASVVGEGKRFHFVNAVPADERASYALFDIDHITSDSLHGSCKRYGISEGTEPVTEMVFFDHKPLVCEVELPR